MVSSVPSGRSKKPCGAVVASTDTEGWDMSMMGAFGMILAGVGLVGIVVSYVWGMAGAKK